MARSRTKPAAKTTGKRKSSGSNESRQVKKLRTKPVSEDEQTITSDNESEQGSPAYKKKTSTKAYPVRPEIVPSTKAKPRSIYKESTQPIRDASNKIAIHAIVSIHLFPRIKFLDKNRDLKFTKEEKNTVCHFVLNRCNLQYDQDNQLRFWEQAKKWIVYSIGRLRSDKMVTMRHAFHGKCI